jgi:hypothetical protein
MQYITRQLPDLPEDDPLMGKTSSECHSVNKVVLIVNVHISLPFMWNSDISARTGQDQEINNYHEMFGVSMVRIL